MPLKKKHWYFPRTNGLWSLKCELDIPWRWKFDAYSQPSFDCNMDIDPLSSSLSLGTCSIYFLYSWNVQVLAGLEKGGAFSESGSLISPKREDQGGHKNLSSSLWPSACKARKLKPDVGSSASFGFCAKHIQQTMRTAWVSGLICIGDISQTAFFQVLIHPFWALNVLCRRRIQTWMQHCAMYAIRQQPYLWWQMNHDEPVYAGSSSARGLSVLHASVERLSNSERLSDSVTWA